MITLEEVEAVTGTPKASLVNDLISAIAREDLEGGILAVKQASEMNLDMKLYLKLIILKFRMAIILRYAPKLEGEMKGDLGEKDLEFLKKIISEDKHGMLRSKALSVLLQAYQNIDNTFVSQLPLELALVEILSKGE